MNHRIHIATCVLGTLLSFVTDARAEVVTLQDAYQTALVKNERVLIGEERVFQSRMLRNQALSFLFPRISGEGSYTRYPKNLFVGPIGGFPLRSRESEQFTLRAEQTLFSGGQTLAGLRAAGQGIRGSEEELTLRREDLLIDVARAYYAVLEGQKIVDTDHRDVARLEAHLRTAQARLRVGEVTRTVVLRAEAELAGARARRIRSEKDVSVARVRLAVLANLPEGFETVEPEPLPLPEGNLDDLRREALRLRGDVKRAEISERIARENVVIARSGFFPKLYLEGTYIRSEQDPATAFLIDREYYGGFRATISFFEGGRTLAETREAMSKARSAGLERTLLEKNVSIEIQDAYESVNAAEAAVEELRRQVAYSQENLTLVTKQFEYGLATHIDVLDADVTLTRAEKDLAASTFERDIAVLTLRKRTGTLLSDFFSTREGIPPEPRQANPIQGGQ